MRAMTAVFAVVVLLSGMLAAGEAPQTAYGKGRAAYAAADKLRAEKKPEEALAAYLQMAQEYPRHQMTWSALNQAAGIARQLKKYEQSAEIYERMLKEFPNASQIPGVLYNIGSLYYGNIRDYAKATKYYDRAATEFPGYANAEAACWQAMYCYHNAKDYPGVIALADRFMASMPQKGSYAPQILSYKAIAHIELGDLDAAVKTTEQMAELAPQDRQTADAYYRLGLQFSRKKEPKRAAECYLKAAGFSTFDRAGACILVAADALRAGEPEEAVKLYRRYQTEYPKGAYVHDSYARIGQVYRQYLKDPEKEIAVYEEFLQKHKKSVMLDRMLWSLAGVAEQAKKLMRAISAYEMILNRCPDSEYVPQVLYNLARVYRGQGDKAKARELFERVIKDYPGYSVADSAANEVKGLK